MAQRTSNAPSRRRHRPQQRDDDFDGPWKHALERLFEPFLGLLFPDVHAEVDWSHPPEFLDKELQKLRPRGRRKGVDKLVRVRRRSGGAARILVHVEVQAQRQKGFARRMFVYHYRLFDREEQPVVSLAVLADDSPSWRPDGYTHELCGCGVKLWFPVSKLKELEARWLELERSDNPFAMVVMAHLRTLATRGKPEERAHWKLALARELLERRWRRDDILNLYAFIDWVMALPDALQRRHEATVEEERKKEGKMPYMTVWERRGQKESTRRAVLRALELRFKKVPAKVRRAIGRVEELERLDKLLELAIIAESMAAFEKGLTEQPSG
jgi:hypothetical protein